VPLYSYICQTCGKQEDAYRSIADRDKAPECHGVMQKIIVPPAINPILGGGNWHGYECPVTGEFVTSRKRRREIMRQHNLAEKD